MKVMTRLLAFGIAGVLCVPSAFAQSANPAALRVVATDDAPKAAGPYSQAIVSGGLLYAAGQTPRDPKTGKLVSDSFEQAVNRVLDNLEAVLKAEGLDWTDVVKTTVFLARAEDFAPMNTVYAQRMGTGRPARTTVVVAGIPGGAPLHPVPVARRKVERFGLPDPRGASYQRGLKRGFHRPRSSPWRRWVRRERCAERQPRSRG